MDDLMNSVGTFMFTPVDLSSLGASEYTLVTIALDCSGSVDPYKKEIESCLQEVVRSCRRSPRADNLMIRLVTFNDNVKEAHGFKLMSQISSINYDGVVSPCGMTALRDACADSVAATAKQAKILVDSDYTVNGILFIITDGEDNRSTTAGSIVKQMIRDMHQAEVMSSFTSILIGVNAVQSAHILKAFADDVGITSFIDAGQADEKTLARLARFIASSVQSQSVALTNSTSAALPNF